MLGGMIGPQQEDVAVTTTLKSLSYFSRTIAGMSTPPIAALSAVHEA